MSATARGVSEVNEIQLKNLEMQGMLEHIKKTEHERDQLAASNARLLNKLIEVNGELHCMIEYANNELEKGITCADIQPPDYFDFQTVHEAGLLINETPQQSLAEIQARAVEGESHRTNSKNIPVYSMAARESMRHGAEKIRSEGNLK